VVCFLYSNWCHLELPCACSHAEMSPGLRGRFIWSQSRLTSRTHAMQSVGKRLMAGQKTREWCCMFYVRTTGPPDQTDETTTSDRGTSSLYRCLKVAFFISDSTVCGIHSVRRMLRPYLTKCHYLTKCLRVKAGLAKSRQSPGTTSQ